MVAMPDPASRPEPAARESAGTYSVVERTWAGGRLVDEQPVARAESFAEATRLARRRSGDRVRLNNQDVTISVETVAAEPR